MPCQVAVLLLVLYFVPMLELFLSTAQLPDIQLSTGVTAGNSFLFGRCGRR
jgi:hypothetical protein